MGAGSRATGEEPGLGKATANWTVIVYLAGDNNLDGAGVVDLREMKKVGSTGSVNVTAQFDRAGSHGTTKRYYLRKGTELARDAVADLGETNTGDPRVLREFLTWGVKTYPARHYLMVIWNHGAGWDDSNLYAGHGAFSGDAPPIARKGVLMNAKGGAESSPARRRRARVRPISMAQARSAVRRGHRALFGTTVKMMTEKRAIGIDDSATDFLDNMELKRVLLDVKRLLGRKIDIVGFDACLMSMLEVGYQVREAVAYTVGSQEEEPGDGWPYDRVLTALSRNPAMVPDDLARTIVERYAASYRPGDGVTLAAADLGQAGGVAAAVDDLGRVLERLVSDPSTRTLLTAVRARVQDYARPYDDYVDLVDLCDGLQHFVSEASVAKACTVVKKAVEQMVLATEAKGSRVARSHGISIYFPKKKVCTLYADLDFAKRNSWPKLIAAYTRETAKGGWR